MSILVLGGNGQLGSCLKDQLKGLRQEVNFFGKEEIDLKNSTEVQKKINELNPTFVINASAYTAVDKAEENEREANAINHHALDYLSAVCKSTDSVLIHISTDYVFDGEKKTPYKEEDATNPQGVYAESKLNGEKEIISSGCNYVILRTAWVFSEHGENFLKTMVKLGNTKEELSIVSDQFGCPTYAQDLAKAIVIILPQLERKNLNAIYHYAGNYSCTWYDFAQHIFNEAYKIGLVKKIPKISKVSSDEYPTQAKRPLNSQLDSSSFHKKFGYGPSDWSKGIKNSLSKLKENRSD